VNYKRKKKGSFLWNTCVYTWGCTGFRIFRSKPNL